MSGSVVPLNDRLPDLESLAASNASADAGLTLWAADEIIRLRRMVNQTPVGQSALIQRVQEELAQMAADVKGLA